MIMQYSKTNIEELEKISGSDPSAAYELGLRYYAGIDVKQDFRKAFAMFRFAANAGNVGAMYLRGKCHSEGLGIWKDPERAVKWYMKAAIHGHRQAMYDLAESYMHGEGVGKSSEEAMKWYRKAAESDYGPACYQMGELLFHEDRKEALKWYARGGELGNDMSAYYAGMMYLSEGEYEKTIKFLNISADLDNRDAYLRLSEIYLNGIGVEKDEEKAKEFFERANLRTYESLE